MRFCITGLPRSRTAWFAAYFTACGYKCAHEGINGCGSIMEYEEKMDKYDGNSDSGAMLYPFKGKTVIIERDIDEVKKSLVRCFGDVEENNLIYSMKRKLDKLKGLRIKYNDIDDRLQEIHEYCVGNTYKSEVADMFKNMNITLKKIDVHENTATLLGELLCH